jgi:hypothetical protein
MRIAFCGAQNTGKTTLIKDFLVCWPQYKTLNKSYRDVISEKGLTHSSATTQETQQIIRDWMFDNLKSNTKDDNIVYDRCLLDNLIYTLWSYKYKPGSIDGKFVDESIEMTKESMRKLDIIFYIPADKCNFGIVDDSFRDTNAQYRNQIDQLFKGIIHEYTDNYDSDVFWPKNDSPGVIEISGTREQRLLQIGDYIQPDGTLYGEEHSILNPEQLNLMETMLKEQQSQLTHEKEIKSVMHQ